MTPSFFLLAGFLGYGRAKQPALLIEWLIVVTVSVLVHELGHALAYRRFGHGARIILLSTGGETRSLGGGPLSHRQYALVSLAGPGLGFLLALVVFAAKSTIFAPTTDMAETIVSDLLWINIGWGLFNLLPIIPLDGGHIMQSIFRQRLGERAEIPAYACSVVVALAAAAACYWTGWVWPLIMTLYFAGIGAMRIYDLRPES